MESGTSSVTKESAAHEKDLPVHAHKHETVMFMGMQRSRPWACEVIYNGMRWSRTVHEHKGAHTLGVAGAVHGGVTARRVHALSWDSRVHAPS